MHIKTRFRIAEILIKNKHINECFEFCNELKKYIHTEKEANKLKKLKLKLNAIIADEIKKKQ